MSEAVQQARCAKPRVNHAWIAGFVAINGHWAKMTAKLTHYRINDSFGELWLQFQTEGVLSGKCRLNEIPFQTYRARLYRCAALMALGRVDEAKTAMKQALAINRELTAMTFMRKETWRDLAKRDRIKNSLIEVGLPR